jgi:hypothetical protein
MRFPSLDSQVIVANALLKIFSVEKLLFQSKINQLGLIENNTRIVLTLFGMITCLIKVLVSRRACFVFLLSVVVLPE